VSRFRAWDASRIYHEWHRYEGTPQRDLFRELRERFLLRHRSTGLPWVLEVGPGPGRFSGYIGGPADRLVQLDLSARVLDHLQKQSPDRELPGTRLALGDARALPFIDDGFRTAVALGNVIGFAGGQAGLVLEELGRVTRPGGSLLLEVVVGDGERSRYLHRLPGSALQRLFLAPVRALVPRIEREGFDPGPARARAEGPFSFRRFSESELMTQLRRVGFEPDESLAVAPCLGRDPQRVAAVRADPVAWQHLLEAEETIGRHLERRSRASALLVSAVRRAV
jgi:SAM-dependent methyltransferase